ncbi:MAG: HNH endonuclease [Acidobacteriia bacterium]|nr:HNH endonuclease [Terriglobia bacterium]
MSTGLEMLDREFSVLVRTRANWKCARCGRNFSGNRDMLHCSHFHSRRHKATRFDLENAAALCWQCHWYMDHHPNVHKVWKLIHIGKERYEALAKRANQISKLDLMKIQKWIRMGMLMVATAESAAFEDLESEEAAHQSFEHISA